MIRRDDGHDWLLIPQVQHAHLAADIAAVWRNDLVSPLLLAEQLISAIRHHDDGWAEWEQSPQIDPETGIPREFTEMPMSIATKIWTRSIDECREPAPLPGIWVSKHFCWLAEQAREIRPHIRDDLAAIDEFLAEQRTTHRLWREVLEAEIPTSEAELLMKIGFRFLQFFDRLSLWLCCAERQDVWKVRAKNFGELTFTPTQNGVLTIDPFPLSVDRLKLSVTSRRIPQQQFAGDEEFRHALRNAKQETLTWTLKRSSTM